MDSPAHAPRPRQNRRFGFANPLRVRRPPADPRFDLAPPTCTPLHASQRSALPHCRAPVSLPSAPPRPAPGRIAVVLLRTARPCAASSRDFSEATHPHAVTCIDADIARPSSRMPLFVPSYSESRLEMLPRLSTLFDDSFVAHCMSSSDCN
jgi:hypothetical protein